MIIKNRFHKKDFALGLILKQRLVASWKWPIKLDLGVVHLRIGPLSNWNLECWFFWREENSRTQKKNPQSKEDNQQQTQPTCDARLGH